MIKFEVVSKYENKNINLPKRGTKFSAGYDIEAADDIIIPSIFQKLKHCLRSEKYEGNICKTLTLYENRYIDDSYSIDEIKKLVKELNLRTMVPTGLKACMDKDIVLEIHPRSSTGANCLLQLANQTGIIDSDYYNNPDNEGHIFVPLINLSPYNISIKKGDKIAQGIFNKYYITNDDKVETSRNGGFGSTDNQK